MQLNMGKVDDILIKAENYNKTSILLTFKSGEQRVLDINWLFNTWNDPHFSCAIKQRWKKCTIMEAFRVRE